MIPESLRAALVTAPLVFLPPAVAGALDALDAADQPANAHTALPRTALQPLGNGACASGKRTRCGAVTAVAPPHLGTIGER